MESMGVASGRGCKEIYRFSHITYPYSSCICSFFAASLLFVHFLKCFSFLFPYFCNLCNNFFTQYKHTYRRLRAYKGSHIKGCT